MLLATLEPLRSLILTEGVTCNAPHDRFVTSARQSTLTVILRGLKIRGRFRGCRVSKSGLLSIDYFWERSQMQFAHLSPSKAPYPYGTRLCFARRRRS